MGLKINGQAIPPEAIEYELGRLIRFYAEHMSEEEVRNQLDALKEKAKDQAIGAKLLIDEAAKLDLRVPDETVQAKIDEMIENCGGRDNFAELLEKQDLTEDLVRAGTLQGCQVDMLVEHITEGLSDPSEEDMRRHFEAHAKEYAEGPRASAQHILISKDSDSPEAVATARAKLETIRRDIESGASFADQATMHSDCPSGKKAGGSLGWFGRGMMVPEFDAAVFSMEVGQLSEIVETSLGLHLIHKTGHQDGSEPEFDAVRDKVRDFLRHVARGEIISAHVKELKDKAVIEDD